MRFYAAIQYGAHPPLSALNGIGKAKERATRLVAAVQRAWAEIALRTERLNDHYQAVFVAPEFYFVNDQAQGDPFLDQSAEQWTVAQIAALAAGFPKLLIIPGTVLSTKENTPANAEEAKKRIRDARTRYEKMIPDLQKKYATEFGGKQAVKNIVEGQTFGMNWAYKGDRPLPPGRKATFYLDEVPNTAIAQNVAYICKGLKILRYPKIGNSAELIRKTGNAVFEPGSIAALFSVGQVRYGLEICMDHWLGILQHGTGKFRSPHIHIITSSETPNRTFHFQVADNGVIVHASTNRATHPWIKGHTSKGVEKVDLSEDLKLQIFDLEIDAKGKATDELRSEGDSPLPEESDVNWDLVDKQLFPRPAALLSELI